MRPLKPLALLSFALLASCGGGGDGDSTSDRESNTPQQESTDTPPTNYTPSGTGQFLDSAVSGLSYVSYNDYGEQTHEGTTNIHGEFSFDPNDNGYIEFFIGNFYIGATMTSDIITPLSFMDPYSSPDLSTNIARFLQTLDSDNSPANGITINSQTIDDLSKAYESLPDINFNQPSDEFELSVEQHLSSYTNSGVLVKKQDAIEHMNNTLRTEFSDYKLFLEGTTWVKELIGLQRYNTRNGDYFLQQSCFYLGQLAIETFYDDYIHTEINDGFTIDEETQQCFINSTTQSFTYDYGSKSLCPSNVCTYDDLNFVGPEYWNSEDNRHEQITMSHIPGNNSIKVIKTLKYAGKDIKDILFEEYTIIKKSL